MSGLNLLLQPEMNFIGKMDEAQKSGESIGKTGNSRSSISEEGQNGK
jgi:hypothetical protein